MLSARVHESLQRISAKMRCLSAELPCGEHLPLLRHRREVGRGATYFPFSRSSALSLSCLTETIFPVLAST
jgi:hypothetical protein